jgi:nucleoid-associated protein YgaU
VSVPTQESYLKAKLTLQDPKSGSDIETIELPFNPKEWSITHAAEWKAETTKKSTPPPEFKGPKPASVTLEVFLDESEQPDGNVSKTVDKLRRLVAPDPSSVSKNTPSAPHVLFTWGEFITFKGYVESVAVTYTMFRGTGTPVRGTCKLAMKEFPPDPKRQNPTSGGTGGRRTHRVLAGDTLASVAHAEYGDPTRWRAIADANRIADPMRLPPGTLIQVPAL